jgi:pyochelin synthetase
LHKSDVNPETNFYSLGGDSLLAAQVVTALRERVPEATSVLFDELLRELLNGASVAEVALFLDDSPDDEVETAEGTGYVLTGAVEAIGNPVHVLINDGFGPDAERLGAELGERDPVIQVPYLAFGDTLAIDDLAHEIVREIRTLSPGPFHLVGVRGGGLLALTTAQQLTELGVPVCGLTLVSSYPLPADIHDDVLYEAMFLLGAGTDPVHLGYPDQGPLGRALRELVPAGTIPAGALAGLADHPEEELRSVASIAAELGARPRADRVAAIAEHLGWPAEDIDAALVGTLALFNAAALYAPGVYAGDVRLLVHTEEAPVWPTMANDARAYWKDVCVGPFAIEEIPGSHFTCTGELTRAHIDLPEEER